MIQIVHTLKIVQAVLSVNIIQTAQTVEIFDVLQTVQIFQTAQTDQMFKLFKLSLPLNFYSFISTQLFLSLSLLLYPYHFILAKCSK